MKSVEKYSVPKQTLEGFNFGMDVIKPLQGLGLPVYAPRISCGAIEIEALQASRMRLMFVSQTPVNEESLPLNIQ